MTTWNWVAEQIGRPDLIDVNPATLDVQTQWMMADALAFRIGPAGGISHWTCGYRYNDGTGPIVVVWDEADAVYATRASVEPAALALEVRLDPRDHYYDFWPESVL